MCLLLKPRAANVPSIIDPIVANIAIIKLFFAAKPQGFFNRHCIVSSNVGEINNIIFDNTIKHNIIDKFMCNSPSDNIRNEPISKLGIIFLKFSSMDELLENSKKMNELIQVRTC